MNYWVLGYSVLFLSVVINCIHIELEYPFKSTSNYRLPILQSYEGEKSPDSNILRESSIAGVEV